MKLALVLLLPLLAPLASVRAGNQDSQPAGPKLDSIAWIAGHWRNESKGRSSEELWMPARGGMMLGLNRTVVGDRAVEFEYLRIEEDAEGVVYKASPRGTKPTPFRLTKTEKGRAVFENPTHDFPKKIEYRLDGTKLTATISNDGGKSMSFGWERVGDVK